MCSTFCNFHLLFHLSLSFDYKRKSSCRRSVDCIKGADEILTPSKQNFVFLSLKKNLGSFFVASLDGNGKVGNIVSPPSHEAGSRLQADLRNCARLKKTNTKKKGKKQTKNGRFTQLCLSPKDKQI